MSNVFFYEPYYNLERFIDGAFTPRQGARNGDAVQHPHENAAARSLKPRMNLHENSERNLVTAIFELPGVSRKNIQIDVHADRLTISAETKQSGEYNNNGYAVRERRFGKFSRTLQLPQGVKDEEIKASMENSVLTVTFPKMTRNWRPSALPSIDQNPFAMRYQ